MRPTIPPRPARVSYQRRDPVAEELARLTGRTPEGARQMLVGKLNEQTAACITAFQRAAALPGVSQRFDRWFTPIEAATRHLFRPANTPALELQAQSADLDEELTE